MNLKGESDKETKLPKTGIKSSGLIQEVAIGNILSSQQLKENKIKKG